MTAIAAGMLSIVAPFVFSRIIYPTRKIAVVAQFAIVSAILLPIVAAMQARAPGEMLAAAPVATPRPVVVAAAAARLLPVASAAPLPLPMPPAADPPLPLLAVAPGFDCGKASTAVEKIICSDSALSALDSQLAQAYKQSLKQSEDAQTLRIGQRSWLANVRNKCRDAACLAQAYERQIEQMSVPQ